jgi:hypothetical protein
VLAGDGWTIGLVGSQRAFSTQAGVELLGAGLVPTRRLSTHARLAIDVLVEGDTVLTTSGAVSVRALSCAPRIAYRAGGRVHAEVALGGRVGIVRMHGEALPGSQLVGARLVRLWGGPAATVALGAHLTSTLAIAASFELGITTSRATARDVGEPVAVVGGMWTSLALTAAIAL